MNKGWRYMLAMLLLGTLRITAQDISGTVKSGQGAGLGDVTVTLLKEKDSSAIKYAITDSSGKFLFEKATPGPYIIRASHTAYITQFSAPFLVQNEMVIVPSIVLYKDAKELQSVTVNTTKPLLERKVDRLVFNVENSIAARGSSLEEALRITPMLRVTEDGISMVGKGGLRVMINDRMVYLSGADLMNYLKSLRSDDVAQIETNNTFVITKWLRYFLSASYMPGNTRANVYTYGQYYVNSGFRASLVDNKLLIGLSFLDGSKNRYRLYYKDFTQYTNTNYHYRTFSLNVSYLFGKPKVKENGKRVDFRETQRAN